MRLVSALPAERGRASEAKDVAAGGAKPAANERRDQSRQATRMEALEPPSPTRRPSRLWTGRCMPDSAG